MIDRTSGSLRACQGVRSSVSTFGLYTGSRLVRFYRQSAFGVLNCRVPCALRAALSVSLPCARSIAGGQAFGLGRSCGAGHIVRKGGSSVPVSIRRCVLGALPVYSVTGFSLNGSAKVARTSQTAPRSRAVSLAAEHLRFFRGNRGVASRTNGFRCLSR